MNRFFNEARAVASISDPGIVQVFDFGVVATTRSSIEALHGRRLSFGAIKPGADKVRKLQVTLPASETARDTMLVLALSEGNGPRRATRAAGSRSSRRPPRRC